MSGAVKDVVKKQPNRTQKQRPTRTTQPAMKTKSKSMNAAVRRAGTAKPRPTTRKSMSALSATSTMAQTAPRSKPSTTAKKGEVAKRGGSSSVQGSSKRGVTAKPNARASSSRSVSSASTSTGTTKKPLPVRRSVMESPTTLSNAHTRVASRRPSTATVPEKRSLRPSEIVPDPLPSHPKPESVQRRLSHSSSATEPERRQRRSLSTANAPERRRSARSSEIIPEKKDSRPRTVAAAQRRLSNDAHSDLAAPIKKPEVKRTVRIDTSVERIEPKPERSLWRRLRDQISSRKQKAGAKAEESAVTSKKLEKRPVQLKPRSLRGKSFSAALRPTARQLRDTDVESVCTAPSIYTKAAPMEPAPLTPRSLALTNVDENEECPTPGKTVLQRCTILTPEPNPKSVFQTYPSYEEFRDSEIQPEPLFTVEASSTVIMDESDSRQQSVFSPPNPPVLIQQDSMDSVASIELLQTHSSVTSELQSDSKPAKSSPRKVFSNPLLSASPELRPSMSPFKIPDGQKCGLRIPNMPSVGAAADSMGTPGGPTLRRMDSSQIEAQCEWIRETLKEESKRLMTMTTMLEGLHVTPRTFSSATFDGVSNQDLNRRYIEKINDLQMENRYLRQLLEFSIGSMRRESWVPTPAPSTPSYGPPLNSMISAIDELGDDSNEKASSRVKQAKKVKGKKQRYDPEYVAQVAESLESKDQLLNVIAESATQLSSLKGWYEKRLMELERDSKRIQAEKAECIKELERCGVERHASETDACKPLNPQTLRVRSMDMVHAFV